LIRADERETRLFGACVAASVALHAAALALGPHLRQARIDPPQVLNVVLAEAPPAPQPPRHEVAAPAAPKPEPPRPRARPTPVPLPPQPSPTPAPVVTPPAVASEPAIPRDDAPRGSPPVAVAAPPVAPRESLVAPDFRAAYLNNPPPPYPRSARRSGEQGTVTLRVHVATDGVPTRVELERSSGSPTLDEAALEAVKTWRFVPARRGTDPVAAWVIVPVIFRLTPGS
jgi:protein TonB